MTELDAIQRNLRMCISTLEILGNIRPTQATRRPRHISGSGAEG